MRCEYCGCEVDKIYKFCPRCGAALSQPTVVENQNLVKKLIKDKQAKLDKELFTLEEKPLTSQPKVEEKVANSGYEVKQSSGFAITGFVLSLCALVLRQFSFSFSLLGLIFSAIGLGKCKNGTGKSKGLAIAGLVISIVVLSVAIIFTLLVLFEYSVDTGVVADSGSSNWSYT